MKCMKKYYRNKAKLLKITGYLKDTKDISKETE